MQTIYTNMDWKATPDYNPAKSTAGEPNAEGIVKCQEGTVARTDELEIHFCGNLSEENAAKIRDYAKNSQSANLTASGGANAERVQSDVAALKGVSRLQTTVDPDSVSKSEIRVGSFQRKNTASDGSSFSVNYKYDRNTGNDYRSDYLLGMKAAAEDNIAESKAYERTDGVRQRKDTYYINTKEQCYRANLGADITSYFSTAESLHDDQNAINAAFSAALREIEENIVGGRENPTAGLKTTVTVNGTEWNFSELISAVEEINKSFEYFDTHITMDYSDYARLGVSMAQVKAWAGKTLSQDKQTVVADALNARAETYVQRERESLEEHRHIWDKPGVVISGEKAKYYDSSVLSASNKEVREEIMKLFEDADYDSPASVANTVNKYKRIMLPIYEAFCGSISAAPDYVNSAVNNIYKYIAGVFGGSSGRDVSFRA